MIATELTVAGAAVALAVLGLWLWLWARAKPRKMKELGFAALKLGVGALLAACTGGLLGKLAGLMGSGSNMAGGLISGGTGGLDGAIASSDIPPLTPGGAIVTVLLLVIAVAYIVISFKERSGGEGGGLLAIGSPVMSALLMVAGASLALTAGGVGLLNDSLYGWVNGAGDSVFAWLNGA
ncbi:hypothetical protein [Streptomyces bohaiensis]|uniref:hypothetical protein n=1 Tax=Streptomyces bohaiensis TaxID=1431344 RepID=UPI003B7CD794